MRKKIMEEGLVDLGPGSRAFTNPVTNSIYIISDNFELLSKLGCERYGLKPNSPEAKKLRKFILLENIIHEFTHQAVRENSPLIGNCRTSAISERAKVLTQYFEDAQKTPEKRDAVNNALELIDGEMRVLDTYNEAVAHYTAHKILCKLGYSGWADRSLNDLRESEDSDMSRRYKGLRFLEFIQVKTHQNPVELTIKYPPQDPLYIEHPDEYLKDLEKGKLRKIWNLPPGS
jgi:hypothetical protein